MDYRRIVRKLLKRHVRLNFQLRKKDLFGPAVDRYARELEARHEALKAKLSQRNPRSDTLRIASEALETATMELDEHFLSSLTKDCELVSLREGMEFIRQQTSEE